MAASLGRLTMGKQWRLDIGAVLVYFALGAMFSAAPRYVSEELDGSKALAGFSVSIFFVAAVLARPVVGRLVDRIGRRPFLVAPPFVLAVLMLCLLGATWVPVVLVVRFLQGLAGSAFYVAAVTTSTDLAPPDRRASAVARLSIAIYLGFALGPAFGEVLLDRGTAWAWPALAALLAAGGLFTATMPESRPEPAADAPAPGKMPLIYRGAVLPGLVLLALGVGYTSITAHSALFARSIGLTSSGALYATFAVSVLLVRLGSGRLADAIGPLRVLYPGIASLACGLLVLSLIPEPVAAVIGVAFVGAGWALVFPAMIALDGRHRARCPAGRRHGIARRLHGHRPGARRLPGGRGRRRTGLRVGLRGAGHAGAVVGDPHDHRRSSGPGPNDLGGPGGRGERGCGALSGQPRSNTLRVGNTSAPAKRLGPTRSRPASANHRR